MDSDEDMSIERMLEIVTQLSVVSEDDRERLRKLLIERTGSANIQTETREVPPIVADSLSYSEDIKSRLTYDPTDYEYYLFYITMTFVIGVIGKQ